jgi:hypothetical protein
MQRCSIMSMCEFCGSLELDFVCEAWTSCYGCYGNVIVRMFCGLHIICALILSTDSVTAAVVCARCVWC